MDKKKIVMIAVVVILLIFVVFLFYFSRQGPATEGGAPFDTGYPSGSSIVRERITEAERFQMGKKLEEQGFVRLTNKPVSGVGSLGSSTVRYIDKATGHIFNIDIKNRDSQRVSNTTISKIFETVWAKRSDKFVAKYMEDIEDGGVFKSIMKVFSATINTEENSPRTLDGVFLPEDVSEVAVSPNGERIFYILKSDEMYYGLTANFNNEERDTIYSSPYGKFNVSWPNDGNIVLLTKPSSDVGGTAYFLNPRTEKLKKIIGGVDGMTVLVSPDLKLMIYSQSDGKIVETKVLNIEEGSTAGFSIKTMPEKCVWSEEEAGVLYCGIPAFMPRGDYPDEWYKGKVSFTDSIWKINVLGGTTELMLKNSDTDATNMILTSGDYYLVFINKADGSLWSLKIKQ